MRKIHEYLISLVMPLMVLMAVAQAQERGQVLELAWRTFVVPQYGTSVDYPAGIFIRAGNPEKGVGQRFESEDGRAVLSVYSRDNEDGDTPTSYLKNHLRVNRAEENSHALYRDRCCVDLKLWQQLRPGELYLRSGRPLM